MIGLRILLLSGLALHKLVWELLKHKDGRRPEPPERRSLPKTAIKSVKIAALGFLVAQSAFLNVFEISRQSRAPRLLGAVIYLTGLVTAILGRIQLGDNWENIEDRQVAPGQSLVTRGIYGYIRHPIYVGDVLLVTGLQLALNSWLFLGGALAAAVVARQALAEEALLSQAFPEYRTYAQRTKMFVPFVV